MQATHIATSNLVNQLVFHEGEDADYRLTYLIFMQNYGILYTNMTITDDDILIHNFHGQGLHGGVGNLPDGQFFAHPRENLFLLDTDKLRVWIL
jgi:hypothetical protein